jgi:hypothetical protein
MSSRVRKASLTRIPNSLTESHANLRASPLLIRLAHAFHMSRGSLRAKFITVIVSLQIALMAAVTIVMERNQREAIIEQARLRALSLGEGLATLSEGYLLSYNFAKLEQVAERMTARDPDVIYTVAQ